MKNIKLTLFTGVLMLLLLSACHEEWLDIKRDKQQVVPTKLRDLQALLDNTGVMNIGATPGLGELSTNDYYLPDDHWQSLPVPEQRNAYIWAEDIYEGITCYSWNAPYELVFHTNLANEGLKKIDPDMADRLEWNNIKGSALFYRSWAFYQLAQVFCRQYDPTTAQDDPGIPLRLESDVNITSVRATVQQTYERILKDTEEALILLPDLPLVKTRPGKAAANALLAKVYLQMGNYARALEYAEACLQLQGKLIDFNTLDITADYPFKVLNEEVIFHATMASVSAVVSAMGVESSLYAQYEPDDLRGPTFFWDNNGMTTYKGSYAGSARLFSGIGVDEIYLIKAECYVRLDNFPVAMDVLNILLKTRWEEGMYIPYTAENAEEALDIILQERRKSLLFRGIHWMDLRRLNRHTESAKDLVRTLNGKEYKLPANDPRYVLPIPDEVIEISGMTQNMR